MEQLVDLHFGGLEEEASPLSRQDGDGDPKASGEPPNLDDAEEGGFGAYSQQASDFGGFASTSDVSGNRQQPLPLILYLQNTILSENPAGGSYQTPSSKPESDNSVGDLRAWLARDVDTLLQNLGSPIAGPYAGVAQSAPDAQSLYGQLPTLDFDEDFNSLATEGSYQPPGSGNSDGDSQALVAQENQSLFVDGKGVEEYLDVLASKFGGSDPTSNASGGSQQPLSLNPYGSRMNFEQSYGSADFSGSSREKRSASIENTAMQKKSNTAVCRDFTHGYFLGVCTSCLINLVVEGNKLDCRDRGRTCGSEYWEHDLGRCECASLPGLTVEGSDQVDNLATGQCTDYRRPCYFLAQVRTIVGESLLPNLGLTCTDKRVGDDLPEMLLAFSRAVSMGASEGVISYFADATRPLIALTRKRRHDPVSPFERFKRSVYWLVYVYMLFQDCLDQPAQERLATYFFDTGRRKPDVLRVNLNSGDMVKLTDFRGFNTDNPCSRRKGYLLARQRLLYAVKNLEYGVVCPSEVLQLFAIYDIPGVRNI
jgi:hypothetical protein